MTRTHLSKTFKAATLFCLLVIDKHFACSAAKKQHIAYTHVLYCLNWGGKITAIQKIALEISWSSQFRSVSNYRQMLSVSCTQL